MCVAHPKNKTVIWCQVNLRWEVLTDVLYSLGSDEDVAATNAAWSNPDTHTVEFCDPRNSIGMNAARFGSCDPISSTDKAVSHAQLRAWHMYLQTVNSKMVFVRGIKSPASVVLSLP